MTTKTTKTAAKNSKTEGKKVDPVAENIAKNDAKVARKHERVMKAKRAAHAKEMAAPLAPAVPAVALENIIKEANKLADHAQAALDKAAPELEEGENELEGAEEFDGVSIREIKRTLVKAQKEDPKVKFVTLKTAEGKEITIEVRGGVPITHKSEVDGPVALVWMMADNLSSQGATRKETIAACVEAGIAFYTARTQYQRWMTARMEDRKAKNGAKA